jgi:uncharacterized protein (TIGR03118 family)
MPIAKETSRMERCGFTIRRLLLFPLIPSLVILAGWGGEEALADSFAATNLVTNDQGANAATITDPALKNAWGISYGPTSPFWVSANGSGVSELYKVDPTTGIPTQLGLTVAIPGDGSVTGQAFNGNPTAFNGNNFVFASEDGTISGWRGALGTTAETLQAGSLANVFKGVTLGTIGTDTYLYAANFRAGTIDVLKGTAGAPNLTGTFTDPNLPAGYAPFNIQNLGGKLYVTYALPNAAKHDDVAGAGHGFVSVFDTHGNFLGRVGTASSLNSPWGMAIAPTSFGSFAGDLLVGNFGDGHINAFNLATDTFAGQLHGLDGNPLSIDGLWGLSVGNDHLAGSSQTLYFSAGPQGESNGLFGAINAVPEPSSVILALIAGGVLTAGWSFKRRGATPL